MKCTIQSIADELELSRNTVARVLSGKDGVSAKTKKLVLKKAAEMGYEAAAVIRPERTAAVPVIPASIVFLAGDQPAHAEIRSAVIQAAEQVLREKNLSLILQMISAPTEYGGIDTIDSETIDSETIDSETIDSDPVLPAVLYSPSVKGVILMDIQNQRIYEEVCKLNLPVVSAGSSFPNDFSGKMSGELNEEINEQLNEDFIAEMQTRMDFVDCNIESCAQRLISSYIRNGRKRIAWAGNPEVSPELYQAVQKVLGRFGLTADVSGESFMHDLFICDSDWTAIRLMQKAQAFGYNIPEEFSVVGFGNIPESTHVLPALTTIQMPWSQVGTSAARCILERLQNPELPYVSMNYCANLIKRDSAT